MRKPNFSCEYPLCNKVYSSIRALETHIKMKHNGGGKKERINACKELILLLLEGKDVIH